MNDDAKTNPAVPAAIEPKTKRERSSLCKVLPTDRIQFDRQIAILRAYAACYESNGGNPVSNEQAGSTLTPKFSASTLGVAVPFFTDIKLIDRKEGDSFVPCQELLDYNHAFDLSLPEAKRKIRPVFENTWFYKLLAPKLRLQPQSEKDCVGLLAIEAKAELEHLERIQPLLNFLEFAGIVAINGGMVSFIRASGDSTENKGKPANGGTDGSGSEDEKNEDGYHTLILPLPNARKITVKAPIDLKQAEIERFKKWAEVTLLLNWTEDAKQ
jgi:hypothetical protein